MMALPSTLSSISRAAVMLPAAAALMIVLWAMGLAALSGSLASRC